MSIPSLPKDYCLTFDLYGNDIKPGEYHLRLDLLFWGRSGNLFCCFSDLNSGEKYRLSVYYNNGYRDREANLSFRDSSLGDKFSIIVGHTKTRRPFIKSAKKHPL